MPQSRPHRLKGNGRCGSRLAIASTALVLASAPAWASDALFATTSLVTLETLGRRVEAARAAPSPDDEQALPVAYAQGGDRVSEAAIDAVPGVALASRPRTRWMPGTESRAWATGYGFSSRTGADERGPRQKSHGAGFMAGVDRLLDPTLLVGVAVGFSQAQTSAPGLHRDFDTFSGGAYLSWAPRDGWELDGYVGHTWVELDSSRELSLRGTLVPTEGQSRGPGFSAAGTAGYRFRTSTSFGEAFAKPFVSLGHMSQDRQSYVESGPFGTGLEYPSKTFERTTLNLGLGAGIEVSAGEDWTVRPELRVAWSRHLDESSFQIPAFLLGTPVLVGDPDPGRDGALVALEMTAWKRRELQAFAGYMGEFRSNSTVHQGRGGVRLAW